MNNTTSPLPLLAYDGECGFCAYWVRYWQRLTGERVRYAPYQEIAAEHPGVPAEEFARAIQLFEPEGTHYSGADAAFRVLAQAPGRGTGLWLYRRLPGFAGLAEATYTLIAHHREASHRWSRLLWGPERLADLQPRRMRFVAAWGFLVLQIAITLTGNYYFLNLLTIFLCLFLFDDRALAGLLPSRLAARWRYRLPEPGRVATAAAAVLATIVVVVDLAVIWKRIEQRPLPGPLATLVATTSRFGVTNYYRFSG